MRSQLCFSIALIGLLATGCDKSGIHPLGQERDTLSPCKGPTTTWMRSTETGTEVFLIGTDSAGVMGETVPGCFERAFIERNSAGHAHYGVIIRDSANSGTFSYDTEYDFRYQPERDVLSRQGSDPTYHDPPLTTPVSWTEDGDELLLSYDGEVRRLTNIIDVIDALDTTTPEGADDVFRMYNLPLLISQTRLLGFGASGMTQYLNTTATFGGTIANKFTVRVIEIVMPKTFISYTEFVDVNGITTTGEQRTRVNLSGNGTMEGILEFRMQGRTRRIEGEVDYGNVLIKNGMAGDGTYTINIEGGGSFTPSYTLAIETGLTGVLPISTP
jgi:hypothetical protein